MSTWNHIEAGQGEPLVLLHGIGMSHRAWHPVMETLSRNRRVIAFDTAGFGDSPELPKGTAPTTIHLTLELQRQLQQMGITEQVDIAGNSMGGWMALEAARLGFAKSVVAISPAGLWQNPPARARIVFFNLRKITQRFPGLVTQVMKSAWARELLMAVPLTTGCRVMPAQEAAKAAFDFAYAPGFIDTFQNSTRFEGGQSIEVPVTVAFGTHDVLLPPSARLRDQLPKQTNWLEPKGWGHVPMWKDPAGVAKLILQHTATQLNY